MDSVIKDKEIQSSISKLKKKNKSSGLDSIRNEMIKSGPNILLPCLNKLFNLIFHLDVIHHHGPKGAYHRFSKLVTILTPIIIGTSQLPQILVNYLI